MKELCILILCALLLAPLAALHAAGKAGALELKSLRVR